MKKTIFFYFSFLVFFTPHVGSQVNFEYSLADLPRGGENGKSFGFIVGEDDQHYIMVRRNQEYQIYLTLFSKSDLSFVRSITLPLEFTDFKPAYEPFMYPWTMMCNSSAILLPYRDISLGTSTISLKGMLYSRSGEVKNLGTLGSKPFKGFNKGMYHNFFSSDSSKTISVFSAVNTQDDADYGKLNIQIFSSDFLELCNLVIDISQYDNDVDLIDADDEFIYILTGARTSGIDVSHYGGEFNSIGNEFLLKVSMKDGSIKAQQVGDMTNLRSLKLIVRKKEIDILGTFTNGKLGNLGIFVKKFNKDDLTPTLDKNSSFDQTFIEDLLSKKEIEDQKSYFKKNPGDFIPGVPDLEICKVHFDSKNDMYLILEAKSNGSQGFASDGTDYEYHRDHTIIGKWDESGNLIWAHFIRKRSGSLAEFANTGGSAFLIKNEKIHIIYYDLKANIDAKDKDKNEMIGNAVLDLALVYQVIDFNGKSETKIQHYKRDLAKPRMNYILSNFYVTKKNELIVGVSDDGLYVNRIGKISFAD